MRIIETPAYRKAFVQYLRRGTPIALSLKAEARLCQQKIFPDLLPVMKSCR